MCLCKLFSLTVHLSPQVPPLRVFLFGPRGSGKTVVGHKLASKMGMFHVAFRDYLQEQILPKMKKPPLVDEEDWEGEEKEKGQWHGLALYMIVIVLVYCREYIVRDLRKSSPPPHTHTQLRRVMVKRRKT